MDFIGGRKPYHDVNGILTCYIKIYDPYLCIGICSIIIILYPCIDCINTFYLPWDQSLVPKDPLWYFLVTTCKYYPIIGKNIGWVIMYFADKVTYE